jgi:hypothetical protein
MIFLKENRLILPYRQKRLSKLLLDALGLMGVDLPLQSNARILRQTAQHGAQPLCGPTLHHRIWTNREGP